MAKDFVIDYKQSYFLDATSNLSIDEIESKPFIPYKDTLHLGFQKGDVWLKLEIPKSHFSDGRKINEEKIVVLSPFILEKITIYEQLEKTWFHILDLENIIKTLRKAKQRTSDKQRKKYLDYDLKQSIKFLKEQKLHHKELKKLI
jgi:hypothetical protein